MWTNPGEGITTGTHPEMDFPFPQPKTTWDSAFSCPGCGSLASWDPSKLSRFTDNSKQMQDLIPRSITGGNVRLLPVQLPIWVVVENETNRLSNGHGMFDANINSVERSTTTAPTNNERILSGVVLDCSMFSDESVWSELFLFIWSLQPMCRENEEGSSTRSRTRWGRHWTESQGSTLTKRGEWSRRDWESSDMKGPQTKPSP